ncbi:MAG: PEGA domain-containing protein [Prevotella sp.]|nr:PEGA domain-containing protein [Prevotella sp.]
MKRFLVVFSVCLLLGVHAAGQNLKVAEFRLLANSTLASTHGTERFDVNGEKCAIIRVVTPKSDFHFDTGLLHLTHQEKHPGEIWLWVSPLLQHLTISHDIFGKCDYDIPITVEGGRTYEMLLDIGTGRFVSITTTVPRSSVIIDGQDMGVSPIYNHYLEMGVHTILAVNDKHEGTLQKVITTDVANGSVLNVVMQDMSHLYADVVVKVEGRADIFYNGKKVETGQWRTQMKEGTHTVETRQADADPQTTTFTVVAGRENVIEAIPPTPHTGYLQIYTRPRNVEVTLDGTTPIDLTGRQTLAVGTHQLQFQRKGYVSQSHEYKITRYETTTDTVQLERIKYVKPLAFYFGGGYTLASMGGFTVMGGAVIHRHDLQLSYTFGASKSDPVHWYGNNGSWLGTTTYKQNGFALKYGYQFDLLPMLGITPQLGYSYAGLSATVEDGAADYADNASAQLASIGFKLLMVPLHHLYVFVAPQYAFPLSKSDNFKLLSDHSNIKAGGFAATLGLLFNF